MVYFIDHTLVMEEFGIFMNEKVTIICQGGWKYTGILTNSKLSPFGKLEWLELTTKNATIKINSPYIVSIIYDNPIKSRKGTKGN